MNQMQPLVSIIIPVYNVKPYLCEALDSVINQTYQNLEIIIVDDGSKDGSDSICCEYQHRDSRIHVIHQFNRGLSAARNAGLHAMQGEFVCFLDSDDAFLPNMIDRMVTEMTTSKADIVVCGYYSSFESEANTTIKKVSFQNETLPSRNAVRAIIDGRINVNVWNKIYRKHMFDSLCFPEGHVYEDYVLMPYLFLNAKKIVLIEDILIKYRKHPGSITTSFSYTNALDRLYSWKKMDEFITRKAPYIFNNKQVEKYYEEVLDRLIRYYLNLLAHHSTNPELDHLYRNEIHRRAQNIRSYSLKSRIRYYLFRINPYVCLIGKRVWDCISASSLPMTYDQNSKH